MKNPNARDNIGSVLIMPTDGVARFDKEVVFPLVMSQSLGFRLREKQKIHRGIIPATGQAIQGGF
jgi:hypothetical protein